MSFLPQFENDLFLSYPRALNEGRDRWVDTFFEDVQARLRADVGDVVIWRDTAKLQSSDIFRAEIEEAIKSSGIFVALISRRYFDRDECVKEFNRFLGRFKAPGGTDSCRLMPIFKQPVRDRDTLPAELHEISHHEFFVREADGYRELDPVRDANEYWERLSRMVQDLTKALEDLEGRQRKKALGKVFIARVGPELIQQRERLRSDLTQRGYLVVPEREVLWNSAQHREGLLRDLSGALLSVHLVDRGKCLDGSDAQTVEHDRIQLELAHQEMRRQQGPAPLVWIQSASSTDPSKQPLVDYIEQTLANEGVDYLQGSLEELKTLMLDMLPKPVVAAVPNTSPGASSVAMPDSLLPAAAVLPGGAGQALALLVDDLEASSLPAVAELKALLVQHLGLEPRPLKFVGSSPRAKDAERLQAKLAACSHVMVCWGEQSEDWVIDLLDLPEMAPHVARKGVIVYACAPITAEKKGFVSLRAQLIHAADEGETLTRLKALFAQRVSQSTARP